MDSGDRGRSPGGLSPLSAAGKGPAGGSVQRADEGIGLYNRPGSA